MNPSIREARMDDAEDIAKVHVASWQIAFRGILPDSVLDNLSVAQRTEAWKTNLSSPDRPTYVLEIENLIQGWATVGPCRDEDRKPELGELYGIYLAPSCWTKGLGALLYQQAETAMRDRAYTEPSLWVFDANDRARRFYEKVGYSPDGKINFKKREGVVSKELRYTKRLA